MEMTFIFLLFRDKEIKSKKRTIETKAKTHSHTIIFLKHKINANYDTQSFVIEKICKFITFIIHSFYVCQNSKNLSRGRQKKQTYNNNNDNLNIQSLQITLYIPSHHCVSNISQQLQTKNTKRNPKQKKNKQCYKITKHTKIKNQNRIAVSCTVLSCCLTKQTNPTNQKIKTKPTRPHTQKNANHYNHQITQKK